MQRILIIVIVTVLGCGPQATQQTQTQQATQQAAQQATKQLEVVKGFVWPGNLILEYHNNAAKADAAFTGKLVTVKFVPNKIKKTSDGAYYLAASVHGTDGVEEHLRCHFAAQHAQKLANIEQTRACQVQGICLGAKGKLGEYPVVELSECKILD